MACVVLSGVSKKFSGPRGEAIAAVNDLSFTLGNGELLVIVGPSGSGKTTTLRLIAGLETPDTGIISLDGQAINEVAPQQRDVAMLFQRDALLPHLSASENLAFGLKLRGVGREESWRRVAAIAITLGIADCLDRKPGQLSSGQRQRVALGRALLRRPKVLLLDEPFASLDGPLRREMRRELLRLRGEQQLTTLLVTHDQAEALTLGERVAVMQAGRLVQVATPAEMQAHPATPFVAEFLSSKVL